MQPSPTPTPTIVAVHHTHMDPLRQLLTEPQGNEHPKQGSLKLFTSRQDEERPYELIKNVAVLPLRGYLFKRGYWWGTSYDAFSDLVRLAIEDYAVDTILIDAETPGGILYGCPDCSDVVFQASRQKRIITVVNDLCASAGLWIGSAANEIVVTQSGEIGSIGVYCMRFDVTEALKLNGMRVDVVRAGEQKAWGNPYLPITPEELAGLQEEVDRYYAQFIDGVARNRRVTSQKVRSDWADARMFSGDEAVRNGLANRVASFDQVLAELVGRDVITGDNSNGQSSGDGQRQPSLKRRWTGTVRR